MTKINKKLVSNFLAFEKFNNLDKIILQQRKFWPIVRYAFFYYLYDEKQYSYEKKLRKKLDLSIFIKVIKGSLSLKNLFGRCDILIYDYGRSQKIGNVQTNPLVYALTKSIPKKYKICIVTKDYNSINDTKDKKINIYLIYKLINVLKKIFIKAQSISQIKKKLEKKILKSFRKKINIESIIYDVFCHQISLGIIFEIIFIIKKPKVIFYSDNAEMSDIIYRAKKRNILTVDVQHSIISNLKILYQHNELVDKSYLSDFILTYSDYWNKFYSNCYNKKSVGNFLNDYYLKKFRNKRRNNNNITIISSIVSRKDLIKLAIVLSIYFPNKEIIYKLRPEEYNSWKSIYPESLISLNNVKFVVDENKELYRNLYESDFVIGTNSTVLLQSIPFSKVIIIKSGWYKEFYPLIEHGFIKFAKNNNEVIKIILGDKNKIIKSGKTLYKPNFTSNIKKFIKLLNI